MLRFFIDGSGARVARIFADYARWYQYPDEALHDEGGCTMDEVVSDYHARELTAAEFLAETRGKAIADKALCLLAEERGCRFVKGSASWTIHNNDRMAYSSIDDTGSLMYSPVWGTEPSCTLAEILATPSGKRHREAIEEFILSLPVVGQKQKVECWSPVNVKEWLGGLRVNGVWYEIDSKSRELRAKDDAWVKENRPHSGQTRCTLSDLLAEYADYPEIVERIRELTGEPVTAAKERTLLDVVRGVTVARICREFTEALEKYGATFAEVERFFVNHVDDDDDAKSWIASYLDVDYGEFASVKDYKLAIARKLGLVGEVAEPQPERGDYVLITPKMKTVHRVIKDATLQEAEAALLERIRGAPGATLSLRLLGPALKTLRSVEERRWNIEEVQS